MVMMGETEASRAAHTTRPNVWRINWTLFCEVRSLNLISAGSLCQETELCSSRLWQPALHMSDSKLASQTFDIQRLIEELVRLKYI